MTLRAANAVYIMIGFAALAVSADRSYAIMSPMAPRLGFARTVEEPPCVSGPEELLVPNDGATDGDMRIMNIERDPVLERELAIENALAVVGTCRDEQFEWWQCAGELPPWPVDSGKLRRWCARRAPVAIHAPISEKFPFVGHDNLLRMPDDGALDDDALNPNVSSPRGIDRSWVRRYMKHELPKIKRCYALRDRATNEGSVFLRFVVTTRGEVRHLRAYGFDRSVTNCVEAITEHIVFPKPTESADVTVGLRFQTEVP